MGLDCYNQWAEKNVSWAGDRVSRQALHVYIRRRLPKPKLCPLCLLVSPRDLSNKTGNYSRNIVDWWYLCRKCHQRYDGLTKLYFNGSKPMDMTNRICSLCGSDKTYPEKNRPNGHWGHLDGMLVCKKCKSREIGRRKRNNISKNQVV